MDGDARIGLENAKLPHKLKLSALWTALMFCYVYGDFFGLFVPGRLAEMNRGIIGPLGEATPTVLVAVSAMMAVPSLMIALTLILGPAISRWSNIATGTAFTIIMALTMPGAPPFYLFLGVIEIVLTLSIVWLAWRWPREAA